MKTDVVPLTNRLSFLVIDYIVTENSIINVNFRSFLVYNFNMPRELNNELQELTKSDEFDEETTKKFLQRIPKGNFTRGEDP